MSNIRVRFAPSPTGFFHIGSARTALFNWLYARHTGGTFILRIEDTDTARNTDESLKVLVDGMRWLGLDWDEGPDVGGEYSPYFQSQRGAIYQEYIQKLRDNGRAYEKDGAVWLRVLGEHYMVYDEHKKCEVEKVKVEPIVIDDAIRGRVEQKVDQDFVIVRSDGSPVFHLVNVVDDITMAISHVIRGEDHLPNTGKHIELYRALGVVPPVFAHIPLILKTDGKGKMSKRDKGALIEEYQTRGYLPSAVVNYIALLGWNPKDATEVFTADELIARFDLPGVNSSASRFDEQKMDFFNTEHLRRMPIENLTWVVAPRLAEAGVIDDETDEDYLQSVLRLCQEKIRTIEDLPEFVRFFFKDDFVIDTKTLEKLRKKSDPRERVKELLPLLEMLGVFNEAGLDELIDKTAESLGHKKFDYFPVVRLAVSGQGGGPDLLGLLATLGRKRVIERMQKFIVMEI